MKGKSTKEQEAAINEKVKVRGRIQLFLYENFIKQFGIKLSDAMERIQYKNEEEIINKYENNIDNNKYFNVIFFKYDNTEDAFAFLKEFIEKAAENAYAKNNSDYPFFIFFENKNFTKEILYSYYLENTKEMKIDRYYELKSHNIFFLKPKKEDIERLLGKDITNYYYEFDFKSDSNEIKSTFINYLLGKLRALSTSVNSFKSLGGTYTHTKYPLSIKDSEGFEVNSEKQEEKIFDILEKNIEEELDNRTHVAFYLIPGPFNTSRDLDYSYIGSLLKLEKYNIHYYLIMTKEQDEGDNFSKASIRFLNRIIKKQDYRKIKSDLGTDGLTSMLEKIKTKLTDRIFTVDVSKKESKSIGLLLNQIYNDLKEEKRNNEKFINELRTKREQGAVFKIDFSGSKIKENETNYEIPEEIKNSPFFNMKKFGNDKSRRVSANKIIKEAQDVSSIRKFFFCYIENFIS